MLFSAILLVYNVAGALQYDLSQFKEKYVRDGKPGDDPRTQPSSLFG